jgi:hypothetical protein
MLSEIQRRESVFGFGGAGYYRSINFLNNFLEISFCVDSVNMNLDIV